MQLLRMENIGMTLLGMISLIALASGPALPQTREETEKRIASMPADQRAFERFRVWISGLPVADRGSGGISDQRTKQIFEKYRVWLKEGGFSDSDISAQIDTVLNQGDRMEAERWNRYFTAEKPAFNTSPNAFLVEMVKGRKLGRALDVAMGQGRNTIWLAQQGWDVTGFDPADQAVGVARENAARLGLTIHTEITTMEQFEFGENKWNLIVLSYAGCGQLARQVERALAPGGIVVVEAFHTDALKTMKIGGSLCQTGELPHLFQGLRSLHYEEPVAQPDFAPRPLRIVRFAAEKPEQ